MTSTIRSGEYTCALCGKGRIKLGKAKKPIFLHSLLFHLTRKQKSQLAQGFPSFDEKYDRCHPHCYYRFRSWATHHQFFTRFVTCAICLEDIMDNEDALVPPCNIIEHSLHKDCLKRVPNGCPMDRVGHLPYRDRLRHTRKNIFLEPAWTVL
jgi:hypothetical protein